ncbi:hypothetical protein [uncultured Stenotrophomonas sp.]|uniref:hypothetical protein n=1 Tax=uncultured Stenotrophomonas sp. TaxID=165438 RepID=UPI0025F21B9D|nr:hypothetical protein [uncultured Stenotrophomonas sp.]
MLGPFAHYCLDARRKCGASVSGQIEFVPEIVGIVSIQPFTCRIVLCGDSGCVRVVKFQDVGDEFIRKSGKFMTNSKRITDFRKYSSVLDQTIKEVLASFALLNKLGTYLELKNVGPQKVETDCKNTLCTGVLSIPRLSLLMSKNGCWNQGSDNYRNSSNACLEPCAPVRAASIGKAVVNAAHDFPPFRWEQA